MIGVTGAGAGAAVVTGANRGVGREIALLLAAEGFSVRAAMRDVGAAGGLLDEAARLGRADRIQVCALDVTDAASIAALEMPDDLAVLVSNAGWEGPRTPVEHLTPELMREAFEVNVFGPTQLARRAVPVMRANGAGVICGVTSLARFLPQPFLAAYRASKAAFATVLESLWGEVSSFGIRVVEVAPGPIATDMLQRTIAASAAPQPAPYDALAERFFARRMSRDASAPPPACGLLLNHRPEPPAEAARRAVAAILDVGGPMRYGGDSLSERVLERWSRMDDRSFTADALDVFGVERPGG